MQQLHQPYLKPLYLTHSLHIQTSIQQRPAASVQLVASQAPDDTIAVLALGTGNHKAACILKSV